jgi:hypothetical protein
VNRAALGSLAHDPPPLAHAYPTSDARGSIPPSSLNAG